MKVINKPYSNKCLIISITMVLFLLFTLAAITMSAKFSNRINIIGTRQLESEKMNINKTMLNLQTDSMTRDKEENEQLFQIDENSREAADKKNESEKEKKTDAVDNFYYYLFGYYIIMVMMSIYMINFMDLTKLKSKDKDELTLDILMFLYFANNGSLIVSIISVVSTLIGFVSILLKLGREKGIQEVTIKEIRKDVNDNHEDIEKLKKDVTDAQIKNTAMMSTLSSDLGWIKSSLSDIKAEISRKGE